MVEIDSRDIASRTILTETHIVAWARQNPTRPEFAGAGAFGDSATGREASAA